MLIKIKCDSCGNISPREAGHVNRAKKLGKRIFCGRKCSGLGRRKNLTEKEKKEIKRLYDKGYRAKNIERLTAFKAEYFQRTYDPEKASIERARIKKERPHIEAKRRAYMATSKYKKQKKKYDRPFRLKKKYGEDWGGCMVLALEIRDECLEQMPAYEIRIQAGTYNKSIKRRRDYARSHGSKSENSPLGNLGGS